MKYQHKKNGKIVTLLETNEKYKTVMVQPESQDDHNGKSYDMTIPTFKRWWKKVEDEDISSDGTSYSQVMKEIIHGEEQEIKAIMDAKKAAGVEIAELDPEKVEIVSESEEETKASDIPSDKESAHIVVDSIKKSTKFGDRHYSMNSRGLLTKGLYIVFRKYGVRIYMAPETYMKLEFCSSIKYKMTDTQNKMLPKSIAVKNENIAETLGTIFNNM